MFELLHSFTFCCDELGLTFALSRIVSVWLQFIEEPEGGLLVRGPGITQVAEQENGFFLATGRIHLRRILYVAFRGVRMGSRFGGKAVRPLGRQQS